MKRISVMLLLLVFCVSMVSACTGQNAPETQTVFPYKKDLSEEAYVQNAKNGMDDLIAYLVTAESDDLTAVLQTYHDNIKAPTTQDNITSSEMMMLFDEHLLNKSDESFESIQAIGDEERKAFQGKNRTEIEKQIPNALRLHNKVIEQSKTDGATTLGTYNFKNQQILSFDEDGSFGVSLA